MSNQYQWNRNTLEYILAAKDMAQDMNKQPKEILFNTCFLDSKEQLLEHESASGMLAQVICQMLGKVSDSPPAWVIKKVALQAFNEEKLVYIPFDEIQRLQVFSSKTVKELGNKGLIVDDSKFLLKRKFENGGGYSWKALKSHYI